MLKSKNRKKLVDKYQELTFVNEHVDTFYVGLNDQHNNQACNPLKAKVIKLNETDDSNVKNWVNPDSQLAKSMKKSTILRSNKKFNKSNMSERSPHKRNSHLYRPLKFVNENKDKNKVLDFADKSSIDIANDKCVEIEKENIKNNFLLNFFDSEDDERVKETQTQKIEIPDTPVQHYGTSVSQRRKLGLPF